MITKETIREFILHKDYYKQLEDNMWNRDFHPDLKEYLLNVVLTLGNSSDKKELDRNLEQLIAIRDELEIKDTEQFELEKYNKYLNLLE